MVSVELAKRKETTDQLIALRVGPNTYEEAIDQLLDKI